MVKKKKISTKKTSVEGVLSDEKDDNEEDVVLQSRPKKANPSSKVATKPPTLQRQLGQRNVELLRQGSHASSKSQEDIARQRGGALVKESELRPRKVKKKKRKPPPEPSAPQQQPTTLRRPSILSGLPNMAVPTSMEGSWPPPSRQYQQAADNTSSDPSLFSMGSSLSSLTQRPILRRIPAKRRSLRGGRRPSLQDAAPSSHHTAVNHGDAASAAPLKPPQGLPPPQPPPKAPPPPPPKPPQTNEDKKKKPKEKNKEKQGRDVSREGKQGKETNKEKKAKRKVKKAPPPETKGINVRNHGSDKKVEQGTPNEEDNAIDSESEGRTSALQEQQLPPPSDSQNQSTNEPVNDLRLSRDETSAFLAEDAPIEELLQQESKPSRAKRIPAKRSHTLRGGRRNSSFGCDSGTLNSSSQSSMQWPGSDSDNSHSQLSANNNSSGRMAATQQSDTSLQVQDLMQSSTSQISNGGDSDRNHNNDGGGSVEVDSVVSSVVDFTNDLESLEDVGGFYLTDAQADNHGAPTVKALPGQIVTFRPARGDGGDDQSMDSTDRFIADNANASWRLHGGDDPADGGRNDEGQQPKVQIFWGVEPGQEFQLDKQDDSNDKLGTAAFAQAKNNDTTAKPKLMDNDGNDIESVAEVESVVDFSADLDFLKPNKKQKTNDNGDDRSDDGVGAEGHQSVERFYLADAIESSVVKPTGMIGAAVVGHGAVVVERDNEEDHNNMDDDFNISSQSQSESKTQKPADTAMVDGKELFWGPSPRELYTGAADRLSSTEVSLRTQEVDDDDDEASNNMSKVIDYTVEDEEETELKERMRALGVLPKGLDGGDGDGGGESNGICKTNANRTQNGSGGDDNDSDPDLMIANMVRRKRLVREESSRSLDPTLNSFEKADAEELLAGKTEEQEEQDTSDSRRMSIDNRLFWGAQKFEDTAKTLKKELNAQKRSKPEKQESEASRFLLLQRQASERRRQRNPHYPPLSRQNGQSLLQPSQPQPNDESDQLGMGYGEAVPDSHHRRESLPQQNTNSIQDHASGGGAAPEPRHDRRARRSSEKGNNQRRRGSFFGLGSEPEYDSLDPDDKRTRRRGSFFGLFGDAESTENVSSPTKQERRGSNRFRRPTQAANNNNRRGSTFGNLFGFDKPTEEEVQQDALMMGVSDPDDQHIYLSQKQQTSTASPQRKVMEGFGSPPPQGTGSQEGILSTVLGYGETNAKEGRDGTRRGSIYMTWTREKTKGRVGEADDAESTDKDEEESYFINEPGSGDIEKEENDGVFKEESPAQSERRGSMLGNLLEALAPDRRSKHKKHGNAKKKHRHSRKDKRKEEGSLDKLLGMGDIEMGGTYGDEEEDHDPAEPEDRRAKSKKHRSKRSSRLSPQEHISADGLMKSDESTLNHIDDLSSSASHLTNSQYGEDSTKFEDEHDDDIELDPLTGGKRVLTMRVIVDKTCIRNMIGICLCLVLWLVLIVVMKFVVFRPNDSDNIDNWTPLPAPAPTVAASAKTPVPTIVEITEAPVLTYNATGQSINDHSHVSFHFVQWGFFSGDCASYSKPRVELTCDNGGSTTDDVFIELLDEHSAQNVACYHNMRNRLVCSPTNRTTTLFDAILMVGCAGPMELDGGPDSTMAFTATVEPLRGEDCGRYNPVRYIGEITTGLSGGHLEFSEGRADVGAELEFRQTPGCSKGKVLSLTTGSSVGFVCAQLGDCTDIAPCDAETAATTLEDQVSTSQGFLIRNDSNAEFAWDSQTVWDVVGTKLWVPDFASRIHSMLSIYGNLPGL